MLVERPKIEGGRVEVVASFSCPGMAFCLLVVRKLMRLREKRSILDLILKMSSLRIEVFLGSHPQDVIHKMLHLVGWLASLVLVLLYRTALMTRD